MREAEPRGGRAFPRRVVVTGIGALSPNGNGRESFWRATRAGESGVARIASFDPGTLASRIAGEVKLFDADAVLTRKERQHVPRVVPLGLAASREALEDAALLGPDGRVAHPRDLGVILGCGGGGLEFTERQDG